MTQKLIIAALALGILVVGFLAVTGGVKFSGGAYEALPKWFGNGLSAGQSQQLSVDNAGNLTAPTLTLSKSSGTSTLSAGCIQTNSSSTATSVKLVLSTAGATSSFNGTAYWTYGTCP